MSTQCFQVKLYSDRNLTCKDLDSIQESMETNYLYECSRFELKASNKNKTAPGNTNVLVVKNYLLKDQLKSDIISELNESLFNQTPPQPTQINDISRQSFDKLSMIIDNIESTIEHTMGTAPFSWGLTKFVILSDDDNGITYSDTVASIYLGEDNYPVQMKWYNNTLKKSEGRKTAINLNKGDLVIVANEVAQDKCVSILTTAGSHIKQRKATAKKQPSDNNKPAPKSKTVKPNTAKSNTTKPTQRKKSSCNTIHRRITRSRPNGKTEKVWRKHSYTLKDNETWIDSWKVNKQIFDSMFKAEEHIQYLLSNKVVEKEQPKVVEKEQPKVVEKEQHKVVEKEQRDIDENITETHSDHNDETLGDIDPLEDDLSDVSDDDDNEDHRLIDNCIATNLEEYAQNYDLSKHNESETDDDAEEIQMSDIVHSTELVCDDYNNDGNVASDESSGLIKVLSEVAYTFALVTIPTDIVLCDESGERTTPRNIFLLLNKPTNTININKDVIKNRVYGLDLEYPVFKLLQL